LIGAVLFFAGAARSLNFSAINTLAFVDIHDDQRVGASALSTMLQQATMALAVAIATLTLTASQQWRHSPALELVDFRTAWFAVAAIMALAALGSTRLAAHAGSDATK
jgi:hypothetical protein